MDESCWWFASTLLGAGVCCVRTGQECGVRGSWVALLVCVWRSYASDEMSWYVCCRVANTAAHHSKPNTQRLTYKPHEQATRAEVGAAQAVRRGRRRIKHNNPHTNRMCDSERQMWREREREKERKMRVKKLRTMTMLLLRRKKNNGIKRNKATLDTGTHLHPIYYYYIHIHIRARIHCHREIVNENNHY